MNRAVSGRNFFKIACLFESFLLLIAVVLGWIAEINPFATIRFSESAFFLGLLGTLILFMVFSGLYQLPIKSLRQIKALLMDTLGPGLSRYHWSDLLILAAIAGISEEVLFRGVIQPWIETSWGATAGLLGSNILFGLAHAVTPLYAFLAALVGIYLGWSLDLGEQRNLLTPIIIHGLYDFLAFLVIMHTFHRKKNVA